MKNISQLVAYTLGVPDLLIDIPMGMAVNPI